MPSISAFNQNNAAIGDTFNGYEIAALIDAPNGKYVWKPIAIKPPSLIAPIDTVVQVGVSKTLQVLNVGGFSATWSATGLPAGVAIDAATGIITATVTTDSDFSITVTASNAAGSASTTFTIQPTGGGGTVASRATTADIHAGTRLYDVGLRLTTKENTDTGDPNYPYGAYAALDLELKSQTLGFGGKALRVFTNQGGVRRLASYIDEGGAFKTRTGVIVSGTFTNDGTNSGEDTIIVDPVSSGSEGYMLGVVGDVPGGILVQSSSVAGAWVWESTDNTGTLKTKILANGDIRTSGSIGLGNATTPTAYITSPSANVTQVMAADGVSRGRLFAGDLVSFGPAYVGVGAGGGYIYGENSAAYVRLDSANAVVALGTGSSDRLVISDVAVFDCAVTVGPITKAALISLPAVATAGEHRVVDSTPPQRRVYPDGTNWRYMDDSIVT